MSQKTDPFIGSNYGWSDGENGWGLGMNETLLQNAFFHNRRLDAIVSTFSGLPGSPTDGQAYFVTDESSVYFRADGVWYNITPPLGMIFTLKSTEIDYEFNGTILVQSAVFPSLNRTPDFDYSDIISDVNVRLRSWYYSSLKQAFIQIDISGTASATIDQGIGALSVSPNFNGAGNQSLIFPLIAVINLGDPVTGSNIVGALSITRAGNTHLYIANGSNIGGGSGAGFSDSRWIYIQ